MYAIQELVYRSLGEQSKHEVRKTLSDSLKQRNRNKLFKNIDRLLNDGELSAEFAEKLRGVLGISRAELNHALDLTSQEKQREADEQYFNSLGPHIRIRTQGPLPSPLLAVIMTDKKLRTISLPDEAPDLPIEQQFQLVTATIKDYLKSNGDAVKFFGKISSFDFIPDVNTCYRFSNSGDLVSRKSERPSFPMGSIRIGGRSYSGDSMGNVLATDCVSPDSTKQENSIKG
ncbi:hypothetical protein [Microbulbifer marinus]|uniref:Uncharacterized protein n=1 Tax=Microbulbifer marinus TaxID=658218 RepID=A0A1H3WFL0_9GAMM|nr:hypothetical protein [Microbulbifer marinus]SDZ85883.1 hypothetical protein SAMN05216562_0815 [Microbulbifer marinus]